MNWEAVGAVGEVGGAIAVVATLGYLAVQIRQNTAQVRVQTDFLEATTTSSAVDLAIRDEGMADLIFRMLESGPLDGRDALRFTAYMFGNLTNFENYYRQYQGGLMDEDQWEKWLGVLRWWFGHPSVREWWRTNPLPIARSLSDLIEREFMQPRSPG